MKKLVVWYNPNKKNYYYKFVNGWYTDYKMGYKNQYNHEVILIIDDCYIMKPKIPLKKRLIKRIIRFLDKQLK